MKCPTETCRGKPVVIDSRELEVENVRRRRLKCPLCKVKFTTAEQIIDVGDHRGGIGGRRATNKLSRYLNGIDRQSRSTIKAELEEQLYGTTKKILDRVLG